MTLRTIQRGEHGQATVLSLVFLTVLLGMVALVLDLGSWFRADRALQARADAAALAAAHALPDDPGRARALAHDYAAKNGGDIADGEITFRSDRVVNDTVTVALEQAAPGLFSKLFGLDAVTVGAKATARTGLLSAARWVAPIVVNEKHPLLACKPRPCFGVDTELGLANLHDPGGGDAAGAFGLINLDRSDTGSVGTDRISQWVTQGFDGFMPLGTYSSVPSSKFNSSQFKEALDSKIGDNLLFPIYRSIKRSGSTAEYTVIGWVGFTLTGFKAGGSSGKIDGHFSTVIWEGIQSESGAQEDFGARAIALVE